MPQLGRLNRGISPAVLLRQPTEEPFHLRFDIDRVGIHANLLTRLSEGWQESLPDLTKPGKLFWAKSQAACNPRQRKAAKLNGEGHTTRRAGRGTRCRGRACGTGPSPSEHEHQGETDYVGCWIENPVGHSLPSPKCHVAASRRARAAA